MSVVRLVAEVDTGQLNVSEFCREHGISRWKFYEVRRRFELEGEAGLEPRSTAPKTVANRTPDWVEDVIVEIRKELTDAGLDAGPATIWSHLPSRLGAGVSVPSEATIWRVLTRRGFVTPEPKKAPKHAYRRFQAERANECWQIDDFTTGLADGSTVKVIVLIDDCTRFCPGLSATETVDAASAFAAFSSAAGAHGWPQRFLSDNAKAFKDTLAEAVARLGVSARHGRAYHPQTQGKAERFHQTIQKWLAARPLPDTIDDLQTLLDEFQHIYNHQRPHRAIGRQTPAAVYAATPKSGPANQPIGTPTRIYHATVTGGACHISNKTYTITVGAIHNGQHATIVITGLSCHIFIAGRLIRQLQLDPQRRYQPLYDRPGRP